MKTPVISIILPVYNGLPYLKESIESVLNQTRKDFELLIVDDCSTDSSFSYLQEIKDPRIRLFQNTQNSGLFYSLNYLIKKTKSPLIKLWAQDDIMNPDCLQEILDFHIVYPHIAFSYSDRDIINASGEIVQRAGGDNTPEFISPQLHDRIALYTGSIAGNISNVTLNKRILEHIGLFDEKMKFSGDFDLWVRLTEKYPIGRIPKPLIQLRNHKGQLSRNIENSINQLKEDVKIMERLFSRIPKEDYSYGIKMKKYRKETYYFSVCLLYFRKGFFKEANRYFKELKKVSNIYLLLFRWLFIKSLQKTNLEHYFLHPPTGISNN